MSDITIKMVKPAEGLEPVNNTPVEAGIDIRASKAVVVPAHGSATVMTDVRTVIPPGAMALLKSRSGMACKNNIDVAAGVIDSSYRGNYMVRLRNTGDTDYQVEVGDKVAQMMILPVPTVTIEYVSQAEFEAHESERGVKGFGSSGR